MTMNMDDSLLESFNRVEKLHWWWEGRRALLSLLLANDKPKKILDIGCGTGETLSFLKKRYPNTKLYGVDLNEKAVSYSKTRGHKHIYRADALKMPFKDNMFDVVLLLDVLEHIKNHQKAIDEAKRVLNKKGKIIITSPGLSLIWSKFDENQGHQRRYTRHEIRALAKKAKMKVDFISYFNFLLSPPIICIRLISKLKPFNLLSNYDRGFNFDIAFKPLSNSVLRKIFLTEINLIKIIKYPLGISVVAVLVKS